MLYAGEICVSEALSSKMMFRCSKFLTYSSGTCTGTPDLTVIPFA